MKYLPPFHVGHTLFSDLRYCHSRTSKLLLVWVLHGRACFDVFVAKHVMQYRLSGSKTYHVKKCHIPGDARKPSPESGLPEWTGGNWFYQLQPSWPSLIVAAASVCAWVSTCITEIEHCVFTVEEYKLRGAVWAEFSCATRYYSNLYVEQIINLVITCLGNNCHSLQKNTFW